MKTPFSLPCLARRRRFRALWCSLCSLLRRDYPLAAVRSLFAQRRRFPCRIWRNATFSCFVKLAVPHSAERLSIGHGTFTKPFRTKRRFPCRVWRRVTFLSFALLAVLPSAEKLSIDLSAFAWPSTRIRHPLVGNRFQHAKKPFLIRLWRGTAFEFLPIIMEVNGKPAVNTAARTACRFYSKHTSEESRTATRSRSPRRGRYS